MIIQGTQLQYIYQTLAAAGTFTIPAGCRIEGITMDNTVAAAVTGGIKIGTTNGGTEVVVAQAVGSNQIPTVKDAAILINAFSLTVDTTLYVDAVVDWNGASINFTILVSSFN